MRESRGRGEGEQGEGMGEGEKGEGRGGWRGGGEAAGGGETGEQWPWLDQRHEGPSGAGVQAALCSHKDVHHVTLPYQQLVQGPHLREGRPPQSKREGGRARSAFEVN